MIEIQRIIIDENNKTFHNETCNFQILKYKLQHLKKSIELNHSKKNANNKLSVYFITRDKIENKK